MMNPAAQTERPELTISPEVVCYIALKAREYDVKDEPSESDPGSNPADDDMRTVLEDHSDDPVAEELRAAIFALTEDQQIDLVALAWLGRGDGDLSDWQTLRDAASEARTGPTWRYLLGIPLLADYLEEGLAAFGLSIMEFEEGHL
jgi:hypothetical protein